MQCPFCKNLDSRVVDSRNMENGTAIRRRRCCDRCGGRFTTYERVETIVPMVIKRDGTREIFNKHKIEDGIRKSCNKRPVSAEQIDAIIMKIEQTAANSLKKEISTHEIGEMVMESLRLIDEVAYVRFASVYRQFKDIDSFMEELSSLLGEKNRNGNL